MRMKTIYLMCGLDYTRSFPILLSIMVMIAIYPELYMPNIIPVALAQQTYVVSIGKDSYLSPNLFITIGSAVTWTNNDKSINHTVTSGTGLHDPATGHEFDSQQLAPGQTFTFIFSKPGSFDYFDRISNFHGRIIVR